MRPLKIAGRMCGAKGIVKAIKALITGEGYHAGFWFVNSGGLRSFEQGFSKLLKERLPRLADDIDAEGGGGSKKIVFSLDDCCKQRGAVDAAVTAPGWKIINASDTMSGLPEDVRKAIEVEAGICEAGSSKNFSRAENEGPRPSEEGMRRFQWGGRVAVARAAEQASHKNLFTFQYGHVSFDANYSLLFLPLAGNAAV